MDTLSAGVGTVLILGSAYIAIHNRDVAAILTDYTNMKARKQQVFRGRLAWLAWGFTPNLRQSRALGLLLALAGAALGTTFVVQSIS